MKIALQLYSVRDCCNTAEEFIHTLKAVKALGYDGVEFAGYHGLSAQELKNHLTEIGLDAVASHQSVDELENHLDELIAYNNTIGCKNIVCAYSPTKDMAEMTHLEQVLQSAIARAVAEGISVLYHNHSHEFEPIDGVLPIDMIQQYCMLELDTYWVFSSKNDPAAYLKSHANKIGLIHLKDGGMDANPCAIGEGKNDIQAIINASLEIGAKWLIVENDDPVPDGLSDAARSIRNLKSYKGISL